MKNKKKEHIHHFVQEFAFEGTSDEKESTPKSEPFFTIDGQLGMLKKQISEMNARIEKLEKIIESKVCLLYTSPSPRDRSVSRMPSSA